MLKIIRLSKCLVLTLQGRSVLQFLSILEPSATIILILFPMDIADLANTVSFEAIRFV